MMFNDHPSADREPEAMYEPQEFLITCWIMDGLFGCGRSKLIYPDFDYGATEVRFKNENSINKRSAVRGYHKSSFATLQNDGHIPDE